MARSRRRRFNAWFGAPILHRKAARRGWGRRRSKGRRTRRNAGMSGMFGKTTSAATSGFKMPVLKQAGVILGGNILTTWSAEKIMGALPTLKNNKILNVVTVLVTAGLAHVAARRFLPKYAPGVLIGGVLAGVTRGVREFAPSVLPSSCLGDDMEGLGWDLEGLGEDMDGLGDWTIGPKNAYSAFPLGSYAHMGQPLVGTAGFGDYANMGQSGQKHYSHLVKLDGMDAVGEEIASQM